MELKIIKSDRQHRQYLAEAESLAAADPRLGTPEGDRLELLGMLIDKYERERYPFEDPDPIAALRFRMEEQGLLQKDLAPLWKPGRSAPAIGGGRGRHPSARSDQALDRIHGQQHFGTPKRLSE